MRVGSEGPRSLDYWILRCCERLGLSERRFAAADYADQVRWLAFEMVRAAETPTHWEG